MPTTSLRIKREADDRASTRSLEYVWVIKMHRFVKISDPLNPDHTFRIAQFDEAFADFKPILGVKPSTYLRVNHKQHRVVDRIVMLPGEAEKILPIPDEYPLKALNLAAPIPVPELTAEQLDDPFPEIFMEHLSYIFNGNQDHVHHYLYWLAHLVLKPETRMNHGIMLSGGYGTGKSFLGEVIKKLIGPVAFQETSVDKMKGRFTDFIVGKRCLLVEEVTDNNGADFHNSMKKYYTSPDLQVEVKSGPMLTIQNHTHWFLTSNSTTPLVIDRGDRRLFYVHSRAIRREDAYYDQLWNTLDSEIAKIYNFLKRPFLPGLPHNFAVVSPPKTEDHQQLAFAAEDDLSVLLADELERGEGFFQAGVFFPWMDFRSYMDTLCKINGIKLKDLKANILELGGFQQRVTIEGGKPLVTWFPAGNDDLPALLKDNSKAGREAVKAKFYSGSSSQPGFDRAKDLL
jgi:hypothetical protein